MTDDRSKGRILLVDPDEDCQSIYSQMLRHCGYAVTIASDALTGFRLAEDEQPDLILIELCLPGIGGIEAVRSLKYSPRSRYIPVVALSIASTRDDRRRAKDAGCEVFLAKPITPTRLANEVDQIFRRLRGRASS